ncbi:hypothetical protein [Mycobacterium neglectum]|uniref:hypothetical protein n=1 Tax=Mycobacterium neglectum TaxID=242737 RepID=UPI000BFF18F7|nr:hypothetical protein [Mycobacterium neglectum]
MRRSQYWVRLARSARMALTGSTAGLMANSGSGTSAHWEHLARRAFQGDRVCLVGLAVPRRDETKAA